MFATSDEDRRIGVNEAATNHRHFQKRLLLVGVTTTQKAVTVQGGAGGAY